MVGLSFAGELLVQDYPFRGENYQIGGGCLPFKHISRMDVIAYTRDRI